MGRVLFVIFLLIGTSVHADDVATTPSNDDIHHCMEINLARADDAMTISQLRDACVQLLTQHSGDPTLPLIETTGQASPAQSQQKTTAAPLQPSSIEETNAAQPNATENTEASNRRVLHDRMAMEALNRSNRFILMPHKRNYLLPVSYSNHPNAEPFEKADSSLTDLNHTEAELQLSIKILLRENIFNHNGHLYFGYTNHSLWQVYNRRYSAPFRETDHQPELMLSFTNDLEMFGVRNVLNEIIINHQSNGQSGLLSRSWNRIMLNSVFEHDNFVFAFTPWYRLPEPKAEYPGDPRGDDNPDISKYMGHFELTGAYKYKSDIFSIQIRNNLRSENYGSIEAGWTFPVTKTMRGYVSYFDGYGHSLIDYNNRERVLGLGIIFTDLF